MWQLKSQVLRWKLTLRPEKPTFPALFQSGFCEVKEKDIESTFVGDINTPRRRMLASQLRLFISELKRLGVQGDLWIDGSFSTKNPHNKSPRFAQ